MGSPAGRPTGRLRGAACGAALLAAAGAARAADVPPPRADRPPAAFAAPLRSLVRLVWFDVQDQLPEAFPAMAAEVRAIFAEIGVDVAWRTARPGDAYDAGGPREIAVIALAEDPGAARRPLPVLGLVVRGQQPTNAFWTFVGNIRRALGMHASAGYPFSALENALLARALARVVAHEVVHVLAPDHPHDGNGLMRHALSRRLLVGPRRPLGPECARSVLASLAQPPARVGPRPAPAELLVAIP